MGFKPYSIIKRLFPKRNINIKDYQKLDKEEKEYVDYTIKSSIKENPVLRLNGKKIFPKQYDFWNLEWNDINLLRHYFNKKDIHSVLNLIYEIDENDFLNLNVFNSTAVYKWCASRINIINKAEENEFGDSLDQEDKEAGVESLERYGYAVTLHDLSGGVTSEEKILLKEPYSVIFRKMCLLKDIRQIQKQHQENARRKAEANGNKFRV